MQSKAYFGQMNDGAMRRKGKKKETKFELGREHVGEKLKCKNKECKVEKKKKRKLKI